MENGRSSKVVAIVALCVGVVGLSLGFAAFSNTLTISSSATVTPSADTFKVVFDDAAGVKCTPAGTANVVSQGTATATTITGINVAFANPGDSVTCEATIKNDGEYEAFLNSIVSGKVTCSSDDSTITKDLMDAACATIEVKAAVGADSATATTLAEMNADINDHSLISPAGTEKVALTITYNGPARADGTFAVSVPTVTLTYSSVD